MCGIAGHITLDQSKPNVEALARMQDILSHRGPSGEGRWVKGPVAFGMRRLSIIDVAGGDQPLYNEDKSIAIVGNGEIYNYKELFPKLDKKGHHRRTGSDIEAIIHLYEDYGVKAFEKLRGMFAICLHDTKKKIVILARDRIGEKPLYWAQTENGIVFSSEMKAIVSFPGVKKELDPNSVERFFAFYSVPEPETMVKGIQKLPPGSYMTIDLQNGKVEITRYWDPDTIKTVIKGDPVPKLQKVLQEISELTLRSDVPVGISLSGGLDSGTVLALAALKSSKNLKAFSVGYEGRPSMDERQQAKQLAKHFGVSFFEREITVKEMVDHFPETIYAADDPIADIASYSIYAVAQLAREHGVPVLLGGVGGDELFWGYPWMSRVARQAKKTEYEDTRVYEKTIGFRAGRIFFNLMAGADIRKTLSKDNLYFWRKKKSYKSDKAYGRFAIDTIRDVWLKTDCIALGDRMSMAASVELRLPLVDYVLTQTIYEHEETVTAFKREQKYFLKQVMKDILPKDLLERKKRGFTPPVKSWIYQLLVRYMPLLQNGYLSKTGVLGKKRLAILTRTWKLFPFFWYHLYTALILEIWCQLFILGKDPKNLRLESRW